MDGKEDVLFSASRWSTGYLHSVFKNTTGIKSNITSIVHPTDLVSNLLFY